MQGLKKIPHRLMALMSINSANGLRVLVQNKKKAAPVVAVCVTFMSASRNEAAGNTPAQTHIL